MSKKREVGKITISRAIFGRNEAYHYDSARIDRANILWLAGVLFGFLTSCTPGEKSYLDANFHPGLQSCLANFTDHDYSAGGFGGGSLTGLVWNSAMDSYGNSNYLMLSQTGVATNLGMDPSWTPEYSSIVQYFSMDGSLGSTLANGASVTAQIGGNGTAQYSAGTGLKYGNGKVNQGIVFDGVNDSIQYTNASQSKLSLSTWFYQSANTSNRMIITPAYQLFISGGQLYFEIFWSGTHGQWSTSGTVALNQWYNIIITYDPTSATNVPNVWLNGIAQTLTMTQGPPTGTVHTFAGTTAFIGNVTNGGNAPFAGTIDELTIWNTMLSAAEATTIYQHQSALYAGSITSRVIDTYAASPSWTSLGWNSTLPFNKALPDNATPTPVSESQTNYPSLYSGALMNGIVGLWHLDDASTSLTVQDGSGTGNPGIPTSVALGATGKFNSAANFNGTTSVITVPYSTILNTAAFSASAWVEPTSALDVNPHALLANRSSSTNGWILYMTSGVINLKLSATTVTSGVAPSLNSWMHIACTYDGTNAAIYINGQLQFSTPAALTLNPSGSLTIGNSTTTAEGIPGLMDEVAIWNRVLQPTEIEQLYRRGANRIKYQVQACSSSATCTSAPSWQGPDGTSQTYFSELYNTLSNAVSGAVQPFLPTMLFSNFSVADGFSSNLAIPSNRYFQYRALMESDDTGTGCNYGSGATWCSPELKSVSIKNNCSN